MRYISVYSVTLRHADSGLTIPDHIRPGAPESCSCAEEYQKALGQWASACRRVKAPGR